MALQQLTPSGRLPKVLDNKTYQRDRSERMRKAHQPIESASGLVRAQIMKMVWEQNIDGQKFQIGFIKHSPSLKNALEEGRLDVILEKLSNTYREVYGDAPWEEYLCCSNPACSGKLSIQDAFVGRSDEKIEDLEANRYMDPQDYICPVDGSPMEYFYDPEQHVEELSSSFNQEIFATLLFVDDRELMGFCMGFETSVKDGWEDKVISGNGDAARENMPYEEYLEEALRLFGNGTQETDMTLNVAEWGAHKSTQRKGAALALMRALYTESLAKMQEHPDHKVPVFAHSLDGSRAFKITSKMGFQWGKTLPSGERRAYLDIQKAIKGIDKMMAFKSVKTIPVNQSKTAEIPEIERDTLVIEMLTNEAVGTDERGDARIHEYLADLANMLGLKPLADSATHLSPKYGLSGWLPLEAGGAIHLYAWDYENEEHTPFISVDISIPGVISNPELIRKHAKEFFKASSPVVQKKMQDSENPDWQELAPQILRQRISISGNPSTSITADTVRNYLKDLAPALDMVQLSEPLVIGNSAWIHWETSGVVIHWEEGKFNVDIYTCKAFNPDDALRFTSDSFGLQNTHHKNF